MGVPVADSSQGFRMMEKVDVNGPGAHPVYQFLKGATSDSGDIKWNFQAYWLIGPSGQVQRLPGMPKSVPSAFTEKLAVVLGA
mmetsp:Transcript_43259/g.120324  ORF Transcript_43259/g.120324 Transcript_43259/m.120324 type:complete len:83 (+) Transcript_43259:262-510(+)